MVLGSIVVSCVILDELINLSELHNRTFLCDAWHIVGC
jgi:hypothetical protein